MVKPALEPAIKSLIGIVRSNHNAFNATHVKATCIVVTPATRATNEAMTPLVTYLKANKGFSASKSLRRSRKNTENVVKTPNMKTNIARSSYWRHINKNPSDYERAIYIDTHFVKGKGNLLAHNKSKDDTKSAANGNKKKTHPQSFGNYASLVKPQLMSRTAALRANY
jgi:hypothetical protein